VTAAPPLALATAVWFAILALASALLGWRRPAFVPCVLVLVDPFALARYAGHTTITSFKAALVGALVGLIARGATAWPRGRAAAATPVVLALLVLATAATIPHAAFRAPAVRETLKALEYAAAFAVAWWAARGQRDAVRPLAAACGLAVIIVALAALRDFVQPQSGVWFDGTAIVRLAGPLEGPNQFAAWLGLALPAALVGIGTWSALLAVSLVGGAAVALTLSRGGIAQTVIAIAGAVWARGREGRRLLAAAALAAVLALTGLALWTHSSAGLSHVGSFAQSVDAGGTGTRPILWHAALAMARAHPLLGVGAGNFELLLQRYGAPPGVRTQANSLYLEAAADGGVVLLLATVLAALVPPLVLVRSRGAPFALAIGIAGLALAAHGLIDDVTFYTKVGQLWWVLAGVAVASVGGGSTSSPSSAPGTR
jgi:O-antigen ligase